MDYILADNQELTNLALESLIQNNDSNVVHKATEKVCLVQLLTKYEDAIVILDYTLFDFTDDEQLLIVAERFSQSTWILISDELTPQFMRRIVYASNQFSIVFKDGPLSQLREALLAAGNHSRYICQRAMEVIINQQREEDAHPSILTGTEKEIVKAIAQGKTTKEIANERFSSIHTITTHRKNIFRKLNVNTIHEVVKYALRAGLIDSSEFYI
ncbi:MAG: response regulator transcription factor [Bacteroidaceae bacterium]|jgi:DNA-binding NarL/FixJ family response regulator|nr:response regulator transcription factor [Bacteroidaceae bacterium]